MNAQLAQNIKDAAKMIPQLPSEARGKWVIIHEERLRGYDRGYFPSREAAEEAAGWEGIAAEAYIVQV